MKALLAAALCTASLIAAPALAQDGGADPRAPDAYAGVSKDGFYAVMQQLDAAERQVRRDPRAMREIRSMRAFANQQQARHGEIRDWDREAINTRLARILPSERMTAAPAR
ncbi:MAG: hypothetical protein B7Y99_13350 [Caulobacterales bacterium 32-69-10]|nr:MAG: hypothetical protein B7Y99_13350 [Caulobacterales bacterium 32-69-10]